MVKMHIVFRDTDDVIDFVSKTEKFPYNMDLSRGSVVVDAKSLLGIMNLGFNENVLLQVYTDECDDLREAIHKYIAE